MIAEFVKSVPVLSKMTVFILLIFSKTEFFLIKIEFFIAKFKELASTEGIARPIAQGPVLKWTKKSMTFC